MSRFAESTDVPVEKSKAELDALLAKSGATARAVFADDEAGRAAVQFRIAGRMVRLEVKLPRAKDLGHKPYRIRRSDAEWRAEELAQRERAAWRRLLLVVKAKFEIIADGGSTVEREFLADILLPNNQTVHEALAPQLDESYRLGGMPKLLGSGS